MYRIGNYNNNVCKDVIDPKKNATIKYFSNHHVDEQLNILYCIDSHLLERFSEIADEKPYADLKIVLNNYLEQVNKGITILEDCFSLIDFKFDFKPLNPLINLVEGLFYIIQSNANAKEVRDIFITEYIILINDKRLAAIKILIENSVNLNAAIQQLVCDYSLIFSDIDLLLLP